MASISERDGAIQRTMHESGGVRAGKDIALVILNKDMNNFIRIIKSLENSSVLIDVVSKTVKHKKQQQQQQQQQKPKKTRR